jgi:hypothetical protein
MQEMAATLDLIVKYGLPLVISFIAIWGVVDLYKTLKKNWAPDFLGSFRNIADNVKGLNESLQNLTRTLADQTPKLDEILEHVKEIAVVKKFIEDNHHRSTHIENS